MPIFDTHVHIFPPRVFVAIQRWFDTNSWNIRYRLETDAIIETLRAGGVEKMVGLAYSHVPGMARALNDFMAEVAARHPEVLIPFGTVLPGEDGAKEELARALDDLGFRGIKIHCHVQNIAADDPRLIPVFEAIAERDKVLLIHCGRGPRIPGYPTDPHTFCTPERFRRAIARFPEAKVIVPHLGFDEESAYLQLLDEFPNLYLDTTMAVGGYLGNTPDWSALAKHSDRILYGSDFPNLPYEWTLEIERLRRELDPESAERILWKSSALLYGVSG